MKLSVPYWNKFFTVKEQIILLLILITGLATRILTAINTQLWRDEVYILFTSRFNSLSDLFFQNHWDTCHPSFYFIFLHFWQKISIEPIFLRSSSLIISFFILLLIPIIAKILFSQLRLFPIIALFLYSFSHSQLSLNIVMRPYAFTTLFALISIIFCLSIIHNKHYSIKQIITFALINFLVIFSDYSGFWLIITIWLFTIFLGLLKFFTSHSVTNYSRLLISMLITTIFCLPLVPLLIRGLPQCLNLASVLEPNFKNTNPIIANLWQLNFFAGVTVDTSFKIILLILLVAITGLILAIKINKLNALFLLILALAPLLLSFIYSLIFHPIFLHRNLFISSLPLMYGFALSLNLLLRSKARLLIIIITSYILVTFVKGYPKIHHVDPPYNWKLLAQSIHKCSNCDKVILVTTDQIFMFTPLYYYNLYLYKEMGSFLITPPDRINNKVRIGTITKSQVFTSIYLIFTSWEKNPNLSNNPELSKFSQDLKCQLHEIKIDHIYLAKCD